MTTDRTNEPGLRTGGVPLDSEKNLGVAVRPATTDLVIVAECACCGAPPARTVRETHVSGRAVFVPYCAECHGHVSKEATRRFGAAVSSAIVVLTLAAGLPLVWQPRSGVAYAIAVLVGGFVPIALGAAWPRRLAAGHASTGRAALFRLDGALSCARFDWGSRVAAASGLSAPAIRFRERRVPVAFVVALSVLAACLPAFYRFHFPAVRVVNLTDGRLDVMVDGRTRASVPPTSAESTGAGVELRVAAGQRVLSARDETGHIVDTAAVSVESGGEHLYAPASPAYCFWIETTGYGKNRDLGTRVELLSPPPRFWALGDAVDLWFSPTPEADFDNRSTGGFLRAVRQGRCDAAPGSLRRAPENAGPPAFATGVE